MAEVFASAGIDVARIAGNSSEMDRVAADLARHAKTEAAKHSKDGTFERSIEVVNVPGRRGVRDRLVTATDPLAAIKEFGHTITSDGAPIGYVPGQHSLRNAINRMPADNGD
jgi:hypothetical protein